MSTFQNASEFMVVAEELQALIDAIAALVAEGDQIFIKAGGQTVDQVERVGEMYNLKVLEAAGGNLWIKAIPLAAKICRLKRIRSKAELCRAYASGGIFHSHTAGAGYVAESILSGHNEWSDNYYPIGHLKGIVSVLRHILS